jgi:hypothetical protein
MEGADRFRALVQAAVEQVNAGALARGVTMLELAERIAAKERLDKPVVSRIRSSAHHALDTERLRSFTERQEKRLLLKKLLSFFTALSPRGLMASLRMEKKRESRRLLLALLEVHGVEARATALTHLQASIANSGDENEWYFQRNLLYVLRRIPRPADEAVQGEIGYLDKLSEPGQKAPLVKEALANLAQIKHEKVEQVLIARMRAFEDILLHPGRDTGYTHEELSQLLDRTVSALARLGTPSGWRATVEHALKQNPLLGDTFARLAHLSGQDLTSDHETVDRLVKLLKTRIPVKLLGLSLQRTHQDIVPAIEAIATTPLPQVKAVLEEIARKSPDKKFGKAALKALADLDGKHASDAPVVSLSGDVEVFGLPMLFQTLEQSAATGVLKIRGPKGETIALLPFESGKLRDCRVGLLRGTDALFQLLERPSAGSFVFTKQASVRTEDEPFSKPQDITPLLLEGMSRYDELQRASALVGDSANLKPGAVKPTPHPAEPDPRFAHEVWEKALEGATPLECEAAFRTDSYRVRRLLAHWVHEGALQVA